MSESTERIERVHCNSCSGETNHIRLATNSNPGQDLDDQGDGISWVTTYDMLQCRGCDEIRLRRTFYFSEWDDEEVTLYPPAVDRKMPRWANDLPDEQAELMREVYLALQAGSKRLATMGARALIDMVILEKVGDQGTFHSKLEALQSKGFIGAIQRGVLDAALDAGNAASHRGHKPQDDHLDTVIDIVESLLQSTALVGRAEKLKDATPKREA